MFFNFNVLAKRYSDALFDVSIEQRLLVQESLQTLLSLIYKCDTNKGNTASMLITSKHIPIKFKLVLASRLLDNIKLESKVANLLKLLIKNNRVFLLKKICEIFNSSLQKYSGILNVSVEVARPLDLSYKEDLKLYMENIFQRKLDVSYKILPDLLGGIVIKYDDKMIDCSMCSRLENIRKSVQLSLNKN